MQSHVERNQKAEESILEAAERLFLEKGFAMTSTTMIAREVGCNQSLVHYYYRSKEKLFQLVFEKYLLIFVAGLSNIGDKELSFEERLKHCVNTQFEMLQTNPEIVLFLINELTINPKRLLALKEKFKILSSAILQLIGDELDAEIKNGNIRPISSRDFILNIFSLNLGMFFLYPIGKRLSALGVDELQGLIEQRKMENYTLIMRNLKRY